MTAPRKLEVGLLDDRPFDQWWGDCEAEDPTVAEPVQPLTAEQRERLQSVGVSA